MYRLIPTQFFVLAIAWSALGLFFAQPIMSQLIQFEFRVSAIPFAVWIMLNLILVKPVWRFVWYLFPRLNNWFPDLNGKWKVSLSSNWPRQEQMLNSAQSGGFDMRSAPDSDLAVLQSRDFEAVIDQGIWKIEMKLYNPEQNTPIKRSDSIYIEPFSGSGLNSPTILYFFKQVSETDNVSDASEFFGAARLSYNSEKDCLDGTFWTARMWRRAMNTAGSITFTRLEED